MKNTLLILSLAILAGSFSSCKKYKNKEVYANVPVYMDYEEFRSSFSFKKQEPLENPGNIYLHNQYIFVCDEDKGIHVLDNSDPTLPHKLGFMKIYGNTQIAIKDHYLYANSFMDLLVIDIATVTNPILVSRLEDVFTYSTPGTDDQYPVANVYKDKGVVVDWEIEKTKDVSGFMNKFFVSDCEECESSQSEMQVKAASSIRVNLAGSRSKFAIIDNYLYALDMTEIKSFNISNAQNPVFGSRKNTWVEPETLFPDGQHLFVGTTTGMMIYDTEGNKNSPKYISEMEHVRSCDPVVVQDDYAYITLRSGSDCGGDINELQVIDITNRKWPKHKESFDMYDPHGLAVDGNLLFVCDGAEGLKVFNNYDPEDSGDDLLFQDNGIQASDVILNNGMAVMVAEDGIYQYNYTNWQNIYLVSVYSF